ncbi:MAG: VanZ family protein [Burkholderiales bacterium]
MSAWRPTGVDLFSFLGAAWPRYVGGFDVVANLVAYMPLGILAVAAAPLRVSRAVAVLIAIIFGTLLSIGLEAFQTFLPARVPSNLDVALNAAGTAIGAIGYALARGDRSTVFTALRMKWFRPGKSTDLGLVMLALWLFTQLNPETLLFGTGDLRDLLEAVPHQVLPASVFVRFEALIAASNLFAVGLLAGALVDAQRPAWLVLAILIAIALMIRTLAFGVLTQPNDMTAWLTQGAQLGLTAGAALAIAGNWLPRGIRLAAAGVFTMVATVAVNLAPGNPYLASSLGTWRQGHFLNFNGLTGMVSALWPFAALAYLLFQAGRAPNRRKRRP